LLKVCSIFAIKKLKLLNELSKKPERWKEIAFSNNLEEFKKLVTHENRRIINWNNLEVVYSYRSSCL